MCPVLLRKPALSLLVFAGLWWVGAAIAQGVTLDRIAAKGVVSVGYIATPGTFAFEDAQRNTVGYSIDLCLRVIDNIRKSLKRPDLRVRYTQLTGAQRIPMLKAGEIDIECGGNTNTVARQKDVDFSYTFFTTGARLLTLKSFPVQGNNDLRQKRVAVSKGTTAESLVRQLQTEQNLQVISVGTDPEGVALVERGQADAFAQDDILLYGLLSASPRKDQLMVSGRFMSVEPYAFMLPKGDVPLREIVDKTLLGLMSSGELLGLYKKWFDTAALRVPMNVYMQENLRFPSKYGVP